MREQAIKIRDNNLVSVAFFLLVGFLSPSLQSLQLTVKKVEGNICLDSANKSFLSHLIQRQSLE